MSCRIVPVGVAVLGLLLAAGETQADPIQWSYEATVTPATVTGFLGFHDYDWEKQQWYVAGPAADPGLTLTGLKGVGSDAQTVPFYQIGARSITTEGNISLGDKNYSLSFPFSVNFKLTDQASQQSASLTFRGWLEGDVGRYPWTEYGSDIAQMIDIWSGGVTYGHAYWDANVSLRLGDNAYWIRLPDPFDLRSSYRLATGEEFTDTFTQSIYVQTMTTAPEPSGLVLAGLGLVMVGPWAWRRWKLRG